VVPDNTNWGMALGYPEIFCKELAWSVRFRHSPPNPMLAGIGTADGKDTTVPWGNPERAHFT